MTGRFPSTRRALLDRWIATLTPLFDVITATVAPVDLEQPRVFGPTYFPRDAMVPEHVRRGVVWFVPGQGNTGFHVDFFSSAYRIEMWSGRLRRLEIMVDGAATAASLQRDLTISMAAVGLAGLSLPE